MIRTWTHRRYRPPRTCDPRDVEAPACARSTLLRGCGDGVRARGVCRVHVHKRNVAVCVRVRGANGDRAQHVRAFGTTTAELLNTSGLARDARRHARSSGEHRRVLAPRLQSPYRSHTVGADVRRARRQGPRRRERSPASKEAVANPAITAVILGQARAQRQAASSPSAAALRSRSGANGGGRARAEARCASWGTDASRHIVIGGWSICRPRRLPRAPYGLPALRFRCLPVRGGA